LLANSGQHWINVIAIYLIAVFCYAFQFFIFLAASTKARYAIVLYSPIMLRISGFAWPLTLVSIRYLNIKLSGVSNRVVHLNQISFFSGFLKDIIIVFWRALERLDHCALKWW